MVVLILTQPFVFISSSANANKFMLQFQFLNQFPPPLKSNKSLPGMFHYIFQLAGNNTVSVRTGNLFPFNKETTLPLTFIFLTP